MHKSCADVRLRLALGISESVIVLARGLLDVITSAYVDSTIRTLQLKSWTTFIERFSVSSYYL